MTNHPTLPEMETLAQQAGVILRKHFGAHHQTEHKSSLIDLVTEVDLAAEQFILSYIRQRYPGHHILAEESGGQGQNPEAAWYVDPLDGTVNYAHGVPIFSVSIAFAEAGQVKLGAVYDPLRDECFSAERGAGAWLNGLPLRVTSTTELIHSLLATGFPYDAGTAKDNNLDHHAKFAVRTRGVRRLGSAALDLCYVAAGRFDGFWELRLSAWDIAAGGLIAREAGALVTDLSGNPDYLTPTPSIVAANPALHARMLEVLRLQM